MHLYRLLYKFVILYFLNPNYVSLQTFESKDLMFWSSTLCAAPKIKYNIYGIFQTSTDHSIEFLTKLVEHLNQKCSPAILLSINYLNDTKVVKHTPLVNALYKEIESKTMKETSEIHKQRWTNSRFVKVWQLNIVILQNEGLISTFLESTLHSRWKGDDYFVIIIVEIEDCDRTRIKIADAVSKLLWRRRKILRTLVLFPAIRNVYIFEPFSKYNNSGEFRTRAVIVEDGGVLAEILYNLSEDRVLNFNGANMTIRRDTLPRIKMNEKDGKPILGNEIDKLDYCHDILIHIIIEHLNFVPKIIGQFQGSDFNVFTATYDFNFAPAAVIYFEDQKMLEFTVPVVQTTVCIAVAKAAVIPQYVQLFRCFTGEVWLWILMSTIAIIIIIYFLLNRSSLKILNMRNMHQSEANETQDPNHGGELATIIVNSFLLMTGASVPIRQRLLNMLSARFVLSGTLLANLTIMGAFASNLYTSFTVAFHYKDIQDTKDLFEAGLWFIHNRNYTPYPFGKDEPDPSAYVHLMRKRVKFVNKTNDELFDMAILGQIATRVTLSDDESVIFPIYPSTEQRKKLHILHPCTRCHHSSYSTMKESPYYDRLNEIVYTLNHAGITRLWMTRVYEHVKSVIAKRQQGKNSVVRTLPAPFNLTDLQSAFYILTIGLIIATISFIAEHVWICFNRE